MVSGNMIRIEIGFVIWTSYMHWWGCFIFCICLCYLLWAHFLFLFILHIFLINVSVYICNTRLTGREAPIFYFNWEHFLFPYIVKHKQTTNVADFIKFFCGFSKFLEIDYFRGKSLKIRSSIILPCGHVMSHKKCGPDRFSRFDVYRTQTPRQTNRHKGKVYIYRYVRLNVFKYDILGWMYLFIYNMLGWMCLYIIC